MYVVVHHTILSEAAFERRLSLQTGNGAPAGVRVLMFLPSADQSTIVCLWEGPSVHAIRRYVDDTLADASRNVCYEVAAEPAFARPAPGLATEPIPLRQTA
jgi:hypothetical protein